MLAACGDSSSQFAAQRIERPKGPVDVVIIGNSITRHAPKPSVGWTQDAGMAASVPQKDYVHRYLSAVRVPRDRAYVRNFYPFETDPDAATTQIKSVDPVLEQKPGLVIVQLGDNVKWWNPIMLWNFSSSYQALLERLRRTNAQLICLSTFWNKQTVDYLIKSECDSAGGRYVYIGDIFGKRLDDGRSPNFKDAGVNRHPKDQSMEQIARRLAGATRPAPKVRAPAP